MTKSRNFAAIFRLIADYGIVSALVLLCVCFSIATYEEQDPTGSAAAGQLARIITAKAKSNPQVVILAPKTAEGKEFNEVLSRRLEQKGALILQSVNGDPQEMRSALEEVAASKQRLDVIACDSTVLAYSFVRELDRRYPTLAGAEVMTASRYYWPTFLTAANMRAISNRIAVIAIIAIAMTMVIITAGIDLSVGSLIAFSAVVSTWLIRESGSFRLHWFAQRHISIAFALIGVAVVSFFAMEWVAKNRPSKQGLVVHRKSYFASVALLLLILYCVGLIFIVGQTALGMTLCCLIAILLCAGIGAFNGTMVTVFRMPPFIVTLAMFLIARGLARIIAADETIYQIPSSFGWLGKGMILGVPYTLILMLVLYLIAHVVMTKTVFGRYVYAVGGNPEAARLSGIPVKRIVLTCYVICGMLAGVGGIITASELAKGKATFGEMAELKVIAAVVVGGTSLSGGRGKIFGTLIGALIIGVISNGMNLTNVRSNRQAVVFGLVILGAVLLDQLKYKVWIKNDG